jgi:hypothetical protein
MTMVPPSSSYSKAFSKISVYLNSPEMRRLIGNELSTA